MIPSVATEPHFWRRRIAVRPLLLAVIAGFIDLGWWSLPWSVYAAFTLPSLLLYALIWWRQGALRAWLDRVHIGLDLSMLALLVRYTGGVFSPFDNLAYIWFFGMVLLYMQRAESSRLPFFSVLALLALAAGTWGSPD